MPSRACPPHRPRRPRRAATCTPARAQGVASAPSSVYLHPPKAVHARRTVHATLVQARVFHRPSASTRESVLRCAPHSRRLAFSHLHPQPPSRRPPCEREGAGRWLRMYPTRHLRVLVLAQVSFAPSLGVVG
ncbi:hypothetical protein DFH09DRAFT_1328316 [Mycena vulgaris]|nr:hypothetical protein DFH09DRAFT_1328316 [Mycena vulgaris]